MRGKFGKVVITLLVLCLSVVILPCDVVNAETLTDGDYQYEVLDDGTVMITDYTGNATELEIPAKIDGMDVTVLGDESFMECKNLTSVIIPEGVKWIGEGTSHHAVAGAFYECSSLESVSIPSSVTHIRWYAFLNCDKLKNMVIPEGVTNIEWGAFEGCKALTKIELPATLSKLEKGVFGNCPGLTELVVNAENSTYYSEGNCIIEKATKNLVQGCNGSVIPNDVTSIDWNAFYGCSSLESIEIPNSVTTIQPQAFSDCTNLKSVKIPNNVTTIKDRTFYNCSSLESVELPEGLTSIEGAAFECCSSLKSIKLPEGITVIDNCTFCFCSALEQINIPNTVTAIEVQAFRGCASLKNITLPASVTTINWMAFYDCSSLKEVTIPSSVTTIDDDAFKYEVADEDSEEGGDYYIYSIYNIDATYYVSAGSYAETWAKNNNLTIQYIVSQEPKPEQPKPEQPTTEQPTTEQPKEEKPTTEEVVVNKPEAKGTVLAVASAKCKVKVTSSDEKSPTVEYTGTTNKKATTVKIPDTVTVNGIKYKVTSIGNKALSGNKKVKKVTVGKYVTTIGKEAFKNCTKLNTVEIKSTILNKIGTNAFSGDKKLTKITLKTTKLTKKSIGKNALKGTNRKLVIKVPKKKVSTYKKYFMNKGNKTVRVKK